MDIELRSAEELTAYAREFAEELRPLEKSATLVTLSGELGAGKTTFTQAVAGALGVREHVTSPTFVLEKIYDLPSDTAFSRLAHIDAYRLAGGQELAALGFDELMKDPKTLVLLEWPEKVVDGLPPATVAIRIEVTPSGRTLTHG